MRECVVVLPAYNEEENVRALTAEWMKYVKVIKDKYNLKLRVVVVNDGSKDSTQSICEELEKEYDNFTLVNHAKNKGLGEAVKTGIRYTVHDCPQAEFMCLMDCDNTHNPKYIVSMLECMDVHSKKRNADVVIASRYQKGAKVIGVAKHRLLASDGARLVYSALLHVKNVRDYTCGYRLCSTEILKKCEARFGDDIIEESGFTCMAELLYKLYCVGARFKEVPFTLRYDLKSGDSKMKVLKTAMNSIRLTFRLRRISK